MDLATSLRAEIESGFARQAEAHGEALYRRSVELRQRDPLVTFLLDTFTRQVPRYASRAIAAHAAGDKRLAVELAAACERAAANLETVRAAVEGREPGAAA